MADKKTIVLGASTNPNRYAYLASNKLLDHGHSIHLIGNKTGEIRGNTIHHDLSIPKDIDTVTMYLGPQNQHDYYDFILDVAPKRVIFNPGTWNPELVELLKENKIEPVEACTLVMLSTDQF